MSQCLDVAGADDAAPSETASITHTSAVDIFMSVQSFISPQVVLILRGTKPDQSHYLSGSLLRKVEVHTLGHSATVNGSKIVTHRHESGSMLGNLYPGAVPGYPGT
eukprot:2106195-Rhodomonas_salina.1